ncbi:unnamed protein product [Arabis nemorensis]|uniref:Uncharacterized protein n=1 Tax=Arabis nemorensis TaxID=586526 RepID=A0A565BTV9_9BRAS|nr:unnamed protein product [Arabis nemorensis]
MEIGRANPEPETTSDPLLRESASCSILPGLRPTVGSSWWQRIHSNHRKEPRWWVRAILKIREWSEIVAGPRWKTFTRRFNSDYRRGRDWDDSAKFKYDPLSYKLSFENENDARFGRFQSFSMRYASVPVVSGKATTVISVDAEK